MQVESGDYILGIWFAEKKGSGNIQMMVFRHNDEWVCTFRVRVYAGDKSWNSVESRNLAGYRVKTEMSEESIRAHFDRLFSRLLVSLPIDYKDYFDVRGDLASMLTKAPSHHWMNIKQVHIPGLSRINPN